MYYHFKIHKEGNGYWAECVELEGCQTQAETKAELIANMHEALDVYLDEPEDSKAITPMPRKHVTGSNIARVSVSPNVAFSFKLRQTRLKRGMTQKEAAQKLLNTRHTYAYQKLESSKTANPGLDTLAKIKLLFPELSLDDLFEKERKRA